MGDYLKRYNFIKELVYEKNFIKARVELKDLLNFINEDMINSYDNNDKIKAKNAIIKLLPLLDEFKKNEINDQIISILSLDTSKFQKENNKNKVNSFTEENKEQNKINNIIKEIEEEKEEAQILQPAIEKKPLTPKYLEDYIGQEKAKQSIKIAINAAKKENRVLEHMLICSPYGLGKTTLANVIANEMNLPFFSINATNIKDTKSLSLYFSKIKESCIVFIDEIHSLKNDVQTVLLSILSDFQVSFIDTQGNDKSYDLPPFTLIGASTQAGELLKPLLNRFTIIELTDYNEEEIDIIVKTKFDKLGYEINDDAIKSVSTRSRGIPRTIEIYAKGIRDIAINKDTKNITLDIVNEYFDMIDVDELGLTQYDKKILKALEDSNIPLALITIESKTGIQKEDLEYRYEPYLIKIGFVEKTERGRVLTEKGRNHINKI